MTHVLRFAPAQARARSATRTENFAQTLLREAVALDAGLAKPRLNPFRAPACRATSAAANPTPDPRRAQHDRGADALAERSARSRGEENTRTKRST